MLTIDAAAATAGALAKAAAGHHSTGAEIGTGVVAILCLGVAILWDKFGMFGSQSWGNRLAFLAALAWWRILTDGSPFRDFMVNRLALPLQHFIGDLISNLFPTAGAAVHDNGAWLVLTFVIVFVVFAMLPGRAERIVGGIANRTFDSQMVWWSSFAIAVFSSMLPGDFAGGMATAMDGVVHGFTWFWTSLFSMFHG